MPANGDALVFAAGAGQLGNNNLVNASFSSVSFAEGAGSYSLGQNRFTSTGAITNSSTNVQTLRAGVTVGGSQTWTAGTAGLVFNGIDFGSSASTTFAVAGTGLISDRGDITNATNYRQKLQMLLSVDTDQTWTTSAKGISVSSLTGSGNLTLKNVGVLIGGSNSVLSDYAGSFNGALSSVIDGRNTFAGNVVVGAGSLEMANSAANFYQVAKGASLKLGTGSLGAAPVQADGGATVVYDTKTLNGRLLLGSGTHDVAKVTRYNGTSISNGVVQVGSAGALHNSAGSNLVLLGGSRTDVGTKAAPGGVIAVDDGASIELNGALLVNNGVVKGTTNVNYGSLAKGSGVYGAVNVLQGGTFEAGNSPGTVNTGAVRWDAGGSYLVAMDKANGVAGVNSGLWNIGGSLDITAGAAPGGRFTMKLASLDQDDHAIVLRDFSAAQSYRWLVAQASGGITGFTPGEFSVDASAFLNPLGGRFFSVTESGNAVYLNFTSAVPEPTSPALLAAGLLVVYLKRRQTKQARGQESAGQKSRPAPG